MGFLRLLGRVPPCPSSTFASRGRSVGPESRTGNREGTSRQRMYVETSGSSGDPSHTHTDTPVDTYEGRGTYPNTNSDPGKKVHLYRHLFA